MFFLARYPENDARSLDCSSLLTNIGRLDYKTGARNE